MSDHFFPWLDEQGHAAYAWSMLGAVSQVTERVELMTYVTCPILRYHPAVVAQKAATVGLLSDGRFTLGLGAGENLNEHVVGRGWPPANVRHEMLGEAVEIIRALFDGGYVNYAGDHFRVDSAKLWDLPERRVPIAVAVSGDQSIERFAPLVDHLIAVEPDGRPRSQVGRGRRRPGRAARSASSRSAGTPTATGPSSGRTSSSAGSAAAGRSTPSCPARPASPGATQFVRPEDVAGLDPVRPGRRGHRRGRRGVHPGRLHRRGAGADRRREPGGVPGASPSRTCSPPSRAS